MTRYATLAVIFGAILYAAAGPRPALALAVVFAAVLGFVSPWIVAHCKRLRNAALSFGMVLTLGLGVAVLAVTFVITVWLTIAHLPLAPFTVFEEVTYSGSGAYDPHEKTWGLRHRLVLDSAQLSVSLGTRLGMSEEEVVEDYRSIHQILEDEGWSLIGIESGRLVFQLEERVSHSAAVYRVAQRDSIAIPTLGKRFDGTLILWPSAGSHISLLLPRRVLVDAYPAATSRTAVTSTKLEEITWPVHRTEDRLAVIRMTKAGPLFRSPLTHWVARGIRSPWWLVIPNLSDSGY